MVLGVVVTGQQTQPAIKHLAGGTSTSKNTRDRHSTVIFLDSGKHLHKLEGETYLIVASGWDVEL